MCGWICEYCMLISLNVKGVLLCPNPLQTVLKFSVKDTQWVLWVSKPQHAQFTNIKLVRMQLKHMQQNKISKKITNHLHVDVADIWFIAAHFGDFFDWFEEQPDRLTKPVVIGGTQRFHSAFWLGEITGTSRGGEKGDRAKLITEGRCKVCRWFKESMWKDKKNYKTKMNGHNIRS